MENPLRGGPVEIWRRAFLISEIDEARSHTAVTYRQLEKAINNNMDISKAKEIWEGERGELKSLTVKSWGRMAGFFAEAMVGATAIFSTMVGH